MSRNTLCLCCQKPFTAPSGSPDKCAASHVPGKNLTALSPIEKAIYHKVSGANFPPGTSSKRFMRGNPELVKLSDKGRRFMAYIAHRFRRQYVLTEEEWAWVNQWKDFEVAA